MLDSVANILVYLVGGITACFCPLPIGNGNSTVRRLPYVTFAIMALNVLIYFGTLPSMAEQERNWSSTRAEVLSYLNSHEALIANAGVRKKLEETGLLNRKKSEAIEGQLGQDERIKQEYESYFAGID